MSASPEVTAFRERVELALANLANDLTKLLNTSTSLSVEDKASLDEFAGKLENLASVVPEE